MDPFFEKNNYFETNIADYQSQIGYLKTFQVSLELGEASYIFKEELNIFQRLSAQNVRFLAFLVQGKSDFKRCITLRKALPRFFLCIFSSLTCLKKPISSKWDVLWWKVPARLYWDLLTSGRYQLTSHYQGFLFQICLVYRLAIQVVDKGYGHVFN